MVDACLSQVEMPACDALSDEAICDLVRRHFHIDGSADFAVPSAKPAATKQVMGPVRKGGKLLSLEEFVSRTLPLLEMEREAEVAQVRQITESQIVRTMLLDF